MILQEGTRVRWRTPGSVVGRPRTLRGTVLRVEGERVLVQFDRARWECWKPLHELRAE